MGPIFVRFPHFPADRSESYDFWPWFAIDVYYVNDDGDDDDYRSASYFYYSYLR